MTERAHTHYQVLRMVEDYRLFAAGPRFLVGSSTWRMNPRKDPLCGNRPRADFEAIALAEDGTTEIDLGDRYRLGEPYDIEFGEHGFIVWSAASIEVAMKRTVDGIGVGGCVHLPFEELSNSALTAIEAGAPVIGLLDYDQFPVVEHGWSPAPAHAAYPPVRLIYW